MDQIITNRPKPQSGLRVKRVGVALVAGLLAGLSGMAPLSVQAERGGMYGPSPTARRDTAQPPAYTREVGVDQKLNGEIPLDLPFLNEQGVTVTLQNFVRDHRPVILAPVYFNCPSVCTLVLNGLVTVTKVLPLKLGRDFQVVAFSIDPSETPELAASKKLAYMNDIKDPQAAESWHFLTAPQETITAVTDAIGFRYYYDEKTEQFAHAAAVILMTPEGRVSRYLFGNNFQPQDVSLALTEASNGRIGGIVQQVLLLCFQYDATMGRYSLAVFTLIRAGGIIVLLGMSIFILRSLWGEKKSASVGGLAQQTARPSLLRRDAESAPVMPTTQQPASGSEKV